jgi:hypothetical protein
MAGTANRYTFADGADIEDVEASLLMAILAAEALHSAAQVRLDAAHFFDAASRACVISADTDVGRDVARLFVSFLEREFGPTAFSVERVERPFSSAKQAPIDTIQEIESHECR